MKYNHMLDVAFTIVNSHEDPFNTPVNEIIDAMQKRVDVLRSMNPTEAMEAFGFSDSYEMEDNEH